MNPFKYSKANDVVTAVRTAANRGSVYLAGGTNLLDLMREGVSSPSEIVDINRLALSSIKRKHDGGISIGALAVNTDVANHPLIRKNYPLLSRAILSGASAQIRNMATAGGNIMQRTRCSYFYDTAMPCNKREANSGCGAFRGYNRMHAVLGWSDSCIAVMPSDMCVALAALEAVVNVTGPGGRERVIQFSDFHRLPGQTPDLDNNLAPGELITSIDLPKQSAGGRAAYTKVRDRASYAFALVSAAVWFDVRKGVLTEPRIALGGVAHKPWRAYSAERLLAGKAAERSLFLAAAELEMRAARGFEHNSFKIELAKRAIVRALSIALSGEGP